MTTESSAPKSSKAMLWASYAITALVTGGLLFSASMKILKPKELVDEFTRLGWPDRLALPLGIVEVVAAVLFVIPRTSVLGAVVITGYLGGATATHVRIDDAFLPPVIMGMLVWGALWLRDSRIRALLPLTR